MINFIKNYIKYLIFFVFLSIITYTFIFFFIKDITLKKTFATDITYYFENDFNNFLINEREFLSSALNSGRKLGYNVTADDWTYVSDTITFHLRNLSLVLDSYDTFIKIYSGNESIDFQRTDFTNETEILSLDLDFFSNIEENKLKIYGIETFDKNKKIVSLHYDLSEEKSIKMIIANKDKLKELIDMSLINNINTQKKLTEGLLDTIDLHLEYVSDFCNNFIFYTINNKFFNDKFQSYINSLGELQAMCSNKKPKKNYLQLYKKTFNEEKLFDAIKSNKIVIKYNYLPPSLFINTFILIFFISISFSFLVTTFIYYSQKNKNE